ncbi:MAG: branched-chain amino acid aminotransferase [Aquiluna sp.]
MDFKVTRNQNPTPKSEREEILANPTFGTHFSDHQVVIVWEKDLGWHSAEVIPYGPILMDPSSAVLHYGQEIFEGIKAYRHSDGSIWTFRPTKNAARLQKSAKRMALPELPTELFVESIRQLIAVDGDWVPEPVGEKTLYLRPFEIAAENYLGVRAANRAEYRLIASPVGPYFQEGIKPVSIWIALDSARAGKHGTGEAKTGGNYAASLLTQQEGDKQGCSQVMYLDAESSTYIEELGGMNLFFVYSDGQVVTPPLDGTILHGITRDSVITLLKDAGHLVTERKVSLEEVRKDVASGSITEVFACGTAAVITPVGLLKSREEEIVIGNNEPGTITVALRTKLTGIQYGLVEDSHNWMHKLAD